MSGVKNTTVSIRSNELTNLRNQANRATNLEAQNSILNRQNAALIQSQNDLQRRLNTMETHNRRLQANMDSFRTQIHNAVEEALRRNAAAIQAAKEESNRIRREIAHAAAQNARNIEAAQRDMSERLRQTEDRLGHQIIEQNRSIGELRRSVEEIAAGNASLAEMADELFTAAQTIARNAQDFVHGVAIIGGMNGMQSQLSHAAASISLTRAYPTNAPAARQTAADAFDYAQDFYNRAAAAEETWAAHEQAARQSMAAAAARLESTATLHVEEERENGGFVRVDVDVDRWSDGELTALTGRLDALNNALDGAGTIEDLDSVRAAADQISIEIIRAAENANIAFYESQNRSATAEDFAQSLSDHGMSLVGHGFKDGDARGAHFIHMRDGVTGDEVIITQTPIRCEDGSITTRVEADLISDTLSGETFERRGREMYATLSLGADDSHTQTEVQTLPGYETRPSDRNVRIAAQAQTGGQNAASGSSAVQSGS